MGWRDQIAKALTGGYRSGHGTATGATKAVVDDARGVGDTFGRDEALRQAHLEAERRAAGYIPLPGLPKEPQIVAGRAFIPGPGGELIDTAKAYLGGRDTGAPLPGRYFPLDKERAGAIAKAYDELPLWDPKALPSYEAMVAETLPQYDALINKGYRFTPADAATYPYRGNPREAIQDLTDNKHMAFFKTGSGFGSGNDAAHPLLRPSGRFIGDYELPNNDVFRVVHDAYGHGKQGYGFRGAGEDNAWRTHAAMYSPEARPAMTNETRGQNSWLNYGPYGEFNRSANQVDTVYAPQKVSTLPDWVYNDLKKFSVPGAIGTGAIGSLAAQDQYEAVP